MFEWLLLNNNNDNSFGIDYGFGITKEWSRINIEWKYESCSSGINKVNKKDIYFVKER